MKRLLTFILACSLSAAFSQNDDCSTAIAVTSSTGSACSAPLPGTSVGATQSMPGCTGTADDDVWYKFTATSASHSLTVNPSINYDAVLEIFSGSCGSLTSISCNDYSSDGGTESAYLTGLTPGSTYYFRVYHYYTGSGSGTFTICLNQVTAPANDNCSAAIAVSPSSSVCASPLSGTSSGATESMPGCAGNADDDVWYQFTATAISHSLSVTGSTGYDAVLELFSGSCSSLTSLGCNDNAGMGGTETIHAGGLTIGNTYYFRVYEYHNGSGSDTFTVCVTTPVAQPPANDACTGATSLPVTTSCAASNLLVNSVGATQSLPGCAGIAEDDIWFSFVPTYTNEAIHVTGLSGADAVVELFSGSCASLTSLSCSDKTGHGQTESVYPTGLTVGQTYYFRIYDYYTNGGDTFLVSVTRKELTASTSSTLICRGQSVTLTASGTPTNSTWSGGVTNGVAFTPTATATYTVSGTGTGGCVNVDSVRVTVSSPVKPDICMVTVDTNNVNNVVYWDKNYSNVDSFIVYREVVANVYKRIGATDNLAFSRFVDTVRSIGPRNGDPNVRSYKYKLQTRDTCGNYSALSEYHTSLFLNNTGNVFTWNFYDIESQGSPVNNYELYRDDNSTNNFLLIGTVPGTVNTFTDNAFSSFPNAKWAVLGDGFSCNPSFKPANTANIQVFVNKTKGNIKNNITIPDPPADPDGIHETANKPLIILMPNPAGAYTEVTASQPVQKINIYNYLGELVRAVDAGGQQKVYLDLQGLDSGVYNIELMSRNMRSMKKLVISK